MEDLVVLEAQRGGPDGAALNRVRKQTTRSADKNLNLKILGEFSQESSGFSHGEDVNQEIVQVLTNQLGSWHGRDSAAFHTFFQDLCADTAWEHLRSVTQMDCEYLFTTAHTAPRFTQRLQSLAEYAAPFWYMVDGYPKADNKKEISCLGATAQSAIYQQLHGNTRELGAVHEQRADLIPLFRTEHGLSLNGLRPLAEYRQAFYEAIAIEQRWDFQFFLHRHWVHMFAFSDEEDDVDLLRSLFLFSLAERAGWVVRENKKGYLLQREGSSDLRFLHISRRVAYQEFRSQHIVFSAFEAHIANLIETEALTVPAIDAWLVQLAIRVDTALQAIQASVAEVLIERMKQDVCQIHCEMRALRSLMRTIQARESLL